MENVYHKRHVRFENLLHLNAAMFDQLVHVADVQSGMRLLDVGAGYGAVTREVLLRHPNEVLECHLLEISRTQLDQAREELEGMATGATLHFYNRSILAHGLPLGTYHRIIAKLVWHEIPQRDQYVLAQVLHRLLAPLGKLVLWQIALSTDLAPFYRKIIRKKDELAGFQELASNRYFPCESELASHIRQAGFGDLDRRVTLPYHFDSNTRLEADFGGDEFLLAQWNDFIRQEASQLTEAQLQQLRYSDTGDSIHMLWCWGLYVAPKA